LEDITTCRIKLVTKEKLKFVIKCMKMKDESLNSFYSEDYVLNRLMNKYLKQIGIQQMDSNIKESDIEPMESYLKRNRIDVDLPKVTKEDLKGLSKALLEKKIVDRKLSYTDVVDLLLRKYLEQYPELKQYLLEYRYINKKLSIDKLQKRIQDEKK